MAIIIRHAVTYPAIYSVNGLRKDKFINELTCECIRDSKIVITIESENSISIDDINNKLIPDVIICDNFKPSKSFIRKLKRKNQNNFPL